VLWGVSGRLQPILNGNVKAALEAAAAAAKTAELNAAAASAALAAAKLRAQAAKDHEVMRERTFLPPSGSGFHHTPHRHLF
jgi:hypothetical protein